MIPFPPPPDLVGRSLVRLSNDRVPLATRAEDTLKDVLNGCSRYLSGDDDRPEHIAFQRVTPILQEGPTCGLVAVGMVASKVPRNWTVQELLEDAQSLGFSKSGEMFSVNNMASFVNHVLGNYFTVELFSNGLSAQRDKIFDDLINAKALYLVPYDADKNHSPGCHRGHKAHWAVVCGAVICRGNFYVLARQGKSRRIGVWPFDDLARSNSNLIEISPKRLENPEEYVFHDLRMCMAGKYIKLVEKSP